MNSNFSRHCIFCYQPIYKTILIIKVVYSVRARDFPFAAEDLWISLWILSKKSGPFQKHLPSPGSELIYKANRPYVFCELAKNQDWAMD